MKPLIHTVLHSNSFHSLPFDHALCDTFVYLLLFFLMIFLFSCLIDTHNSNNRFLQHWKVQKSILIINLHRAITWYYSIKNSLKAHAFRLHVDEADDCCTISYPSNVTWLQNKCIYIFCTPTFCRKEKNMLSKKKFIRCSNELVSHMNSLIASTGVGMTKIKSEETGTDAAVSDCGMKCRWQTKN